MNPVIAIDGPAASGKSTVARRVAQELGWVYVDTGAMYRAVTWQMLRRHVPTDQPDHIVAYLVNMPFTCEIVNGATTLVCEEPVPPEALRAPEVAENVSLVAAIPEVRTRLVNVQRCLLARASLVMEGRDIGSAVFPDTPFKFYLDASVAVREARRASQGEDDRIALRDKIDSSRAVAPLQIALGAEVIDTSLHDADSVARHILRKVRAALAARYA